MAINLSRYHANTLLAAVRHISGNIFVFQQGFTPAHRAREQSSFYDSQHTLLIRQYILPLIHPI